MLFSLLSFPGELRSQIEFIPDVDSICAGTTITLNYNGTWSPGHRWINLGIPFISSDQTVDVLFPWTGLRIVTVIDFFSFSLDFRPLRVVPQPTGPTLNVKSPAGVPCEGEMVSATFNPGAGGVGCSDEFRFSTRTGATWFGPFPYTGGLTLPTGGVDQIRIEGRRAGCDPDAGCNETPWTILTQWTITNDPIPPVISSCATDKVINAGAACQAVVPDLTPEVVASDNCDPSPVITQLPAAGSLIGKGVTTVTLTVFDAGGNSATCNADITVTDVTPPAFLSCPADVIAPADTGYCGALVTWALPTASDNCPGMVLTSNYSPGDFFPVGNTTVTYTATDAGGLTDVCSFDVIVQAAPDPVINGPVNVCSPGLETYSVVDPGSHSFLWNIVNGIIQGSATGPSVVVEWTGVIQGMVSVTITSGSGCSTANSVTVDKNPSAVTGEIQSNSSLTRR